jgi:FkbM family methyltransferase
VRSLLKRLRALPAVNSAVVFPVRAAMRALGADWAPVVAHLPRSGVTRSRLPDGAILRFRSSGDDFVPNQVFWRGWRGYEPEQASLFYALARRSRGTVDVGAHVGYYAILAGLANPAGRVLAFEPLPEVFDRLRENLALNPAAPVTAIRSALAEEAGDAEMFRVHLGIPCSSSLSRDFMEGAHAGVLSVTVPVQVADEAVAAADLERVDLVKIDTETTEPAVLAGMRATIARDRPDIFCEVLPQADAGALQRLLAPHGYRWYQLTDDGPRERGEIAADPRLVNWLFSARPETQRELADGGRPA